MDILPVPFLVCATLTKKVVCTPTGLVEEPQQGGRPLEAPHTGVSCTPRPCLQAAFPGLLPNRRARTEALGAYSESRHPRACLGVSPD